MDIYEEPRNELRRSKMFNQLGTIRRGEFKRLFKNEGAQRPRRKSRELHLPIQEIARFEKERRSREPRLARKEASVKVPSKTLSGIEEILENRRELERLRGKSEGDESEEIPAGFEHLEVTASEKIGQKMLYEWVNQCYESFKTPEQFSREELKRIVDWGRRRRLAFDSHFGNIDEQAVREPFDEPDRDVSSDVEILSVEGSEGDLRRKVERENHAKHGSGHPGITKKKQSAPKKKRQMVEKLQEGVTFKLEQFYIHDLQELNSLAYDEELFILNPSGEFMGSWRVNVKICEDDENLANVQFEGLLATEDNTTYGMYSCGLVDRYYCPRTELRVEQTSRFDDTFSKTMFFHEKQRRWLFDVRNAKNGLETASTFKLHYDQMVHVVSESAHILLMRKIVIYRCPLIFDEENHKANCIQVQCTCPAGFPTRKRFVLKMKTLCISGDVCRANYRFYAPVKVRFHHQDLDIVRIRRRVETPGKLIQTSNFYMTTAGQLVAITFNDPYPYDTPYYLQIDPKAVLDPTRVIPPERVVPLRERYMCDPKLKNYYEEEVVRLQSIHKAYLETHKPLMTVVKMILLELLADKPHRALQYVRNFMMHTTRGFLGKMVDD